MKEWYNRLNKSKYTPSSWVFSVVWPILYICMIISFIIVKRNEKCKNYCNPLKFFTIQLLFNLIWTTIFFKFKNIKLALLDLILIIIFTLITIIQFYKISLTATLFLIPYFLWLCFALYLNLYIVFNN